MSDESPNLNDFALINDWCALLDLLKIVLSDVLSAPDLLNGLCVTAPVLLQINQTVRVSLDP